MPATRLVLTVTGAACAAVLAVPSALTSDASAPAEDTDRATHRGHAVLGTPSAVGRAGRLPRIRGYVGADATFTISKHKVPKGRYRVVVKDETASHNWHLEGRGVDKATTLDGIGTWVWRVRLRRGTYTAVCDTHPASMNASLKVTSN